jgi:hypothetical protein
MRSRATRAWRKVLRRLATQVLIDGAWVALTALLPTPSVPVGRVRPFAYRSSRTTTVYGGGRTLSFGTAQVSRLRSTPAKSRPYLPVVVIPDGRTTHVRGPFGAWTITGLYARKHTSILGGGL